MIIIKQGKSNWRYVLIVGILAVIVIAGVFICRYSWVQEDIEKITVPSKNGSRGEPPATQLPNPASVYCEEQEGLLDIRTWENGSQTGFCIFSDGSECEEWAFFRNECEKGQNLCKDLCGDGICQEIVCMAIGCPCAETAENCPQDCN